MKTIVFIHDDKPDHYGNKVDIEGLAFPASVPVRLNFSGDPIGTAKLQREGDKITADINLTAAILGKILYPAIGFRAIELNEDLLNMASSINKAEIIEISLGDSNVDKRIPPIDFTPKNRVQSIHIMDTNARFDREVEWRPSADIVVPGLGIVHIADCLSQETIDKLCEEVLFALNQKMGVKA